MKTFKSFRIEDILVDTSKSDSNVASERYNYEITHSTSEESFKAKASSENKERTEVDNEEVKLKSEAVSETEATKIETGISRFSPFPLSQVPIENGGKLQSYSSILPYYSVDHALRISQNRSLLKHYASASHILSFPAFSPFQRSHFGSGGVDYAIAYPGIGGHYGISHPTVTDCNRDGLYEKGPYINEKGHYPLYSLSRPMYASSCKRKGGQIRFNNSQTGQLEKAFVHQKYLNATERKKLAHDLGLSDRQIKTWFQNRRAKLRKSKGTQCSDMEIPGSPQDHHIDASSQYVDSPYEIQIAD